MVTGGFRSVQGMNAALQSSACDLIGIARPFALQTDLTEQLIAGQDVKYAIRPVKSGWAALDKKAILEIIWYAAQFKAIAQGKAPNPNLSPIWVFLKYARRNAKAILYGRLNSRVQSGQ